jgi:hypothetical protein
VNGQKLFCLAAFRKRRFRLRKMSLKQRVQLAGWEKIRKNELFFIASTFANPKFLAHAQF